MPDKTALTVIDWLAALIERSWLVIGCALLFALGWWTMHLRAPSSYNSSALLALSAEQAAAAESITRSPVVIDTIASKFPALQRETPEATRRKINERISWDATESQRKLKATLFELNVEDSDPSRAQTTANMLIDSWLELTKPKPITRARIEVEIGRLEQQLKETMVLQEKLQSEAKSLLVPNSLQGELAGPLVRLLSEREGLVSRLAEKTGALHGVSREIVVSPPTLPIEDVRTLTVTKGVLLSGIIGGVVGAILAMMLEWFRRNQEASGLLSDAMKHSIGR